MNSKKGKTAVVDFQSLVVPINQCSKNEVIEKYRNHEADVGSCTVQVALLTQRIEQLKVHFAKNHKDNSSRRGMMRLISERKGLLAYLRKTNPGQYKALIGSLGLRK
jgi:small subunit ribosomal protein S15